MNPRTIENLRTAMQGEAFTAAKYKRFAALARVSNQWQLADLFTNIAEANRTDHFASEAHLAGIVSDNIADLQDAINDKACQMDRYEEFAKQAEVDGDHGASTLFRRVREDDRRELVELKAALETLRQKQ